MLGAYVASKMQSPVEYAPLPEVVTYFDCCSSTAKWALSSRSLDAAILCPDEARSLVERDNGYEIVGPCLANSVVAVVRNVSEITRVGIAQNRGYQETIARALFGDEVSVRPMLAQALAGAYARQAVDAVIVDIDQAYRLQGRKISVKTGKEDVVTYVLVARKDMRELESLVRVFASAAEELNEEGDLRRAIESWREDPVSMEEAGDWLRGGVHFMAPTLDAALRASYATGKVK
jgi:hypothetical protein